MQFSLALLVGTLLCPVTSTFLSQNSELSINSNGYTLIFANALWRHGDRAPEHPLAGGADKVTEEMWRLGGGGYGELSPTGMKQHFSLGRKIRTRYVDGGFLSKRYRQKEMYVRSTDYNRTLISAYSNLAGMYSSTADNKPGTDYPNSNNWIAGWVPIPIHTVLNPTDHLGNPDADCKRYNQIVSLIHNSAEVKAFASQPKVVQTLDYLSKQTNSKVDFFNAYHVNDTMWCEFIHFDDVRHLDDPSFNISDWYPWFWGTDNIPELVKYINDQDSEFLDGIGFPNKLQSGGQVIDVSKEVPVLRAGSTAHSIAEYAEAVVNCYKKNNWGENHNCSDFFSNLKYFVISAHDSTLNAYLTLNGARNHVLRYGNPQYSAALLHEFYFKNDTKEIFVKFLYHPNENEDFRVITRFIDGCNIDSDYCPFSVFLDMANNHNPGNIEKLCNTDLPGFSTAAPQFE